MMDEFRVRDRDAPISPEGIIFRAYGYKHPRESCICDVEYADSSIYQSEDPRAPRSSTTGKYYKFYADGGLNFVKEKFPQYLIFHEPLQRKLVGIKKSQMKELRRPDKKLNEILKLNPPDPLIEVLFDILELIKAHSQLIPSNFGIFGSILHDFYNLDYSDIDLIIYGRKNLAELRELLSDFYMDESFPISNEFDKPASQTTPGHWYFTNYSVKEYLKYQRVKRIYAVIKSKKIPRTVKIEFEPVKNWTEITEKYDTQTRIQPIGWVRAVGRILDDANGFFMEAGYPIEIEKILEGPKIDEITKILSYVEEFRGQLSTDDRFIVEGNLEKVTSPKNEYYQITLTYGPNYYKQMLKKY